MVETKPLSRKPDAIPIVYNVPEIAALLGINVISAYELAKREDFPAIRIGRRIVVPREAFERWLNEQTQAHDSAEDIFAAIEQDEKVQARIGRAIVEWSVGRRAPKGLDMKKQFGYVLALSDLREIIKQAAKEGAQP